MDREALERENGVVLDAVQAMLGLISSEVIAVAVLVESDRVEFSFWVRRHTDQLAEDIDAILFEMDALSDVHPVFESRVRVGEPDPAMLASYGRMIYWAK